MNMDAHLYVYHRNICIQNRVHVVVDPEHPGKTQMLNIRIYSDRKKNYFYSNVYIKLKSNAFEELCHLKDCY
jgi:hypothetical protein